MLKCLKVLTEEEEAVERYKVIIEAMQVPCWFRTYLLVPTSLLRSFLKQRRNEGQMRTLGARLDFAAGGFQLD